MPRVDDFIGELWDRFHTGHSHDSEGDGFLLLSDHGFTAVQQELNVNAWLREQGYLRYRIETPTTIADLAPESRAFALDPGRIYLRRRSRFTNGCLDDDEADALAAELAARLRALTHDGRPAVTHVFPRAEIFHGPRAHLAPDLVLLGREGLDLKAAVQPRAVFTDTHFQGMHTWDNAFAWTTAALPTVPEIADLAGVILDPVLSMNRHTATA